ncbi:hypothetical protein KDA_68360 [Dictyobacter alpinus]|uniref:Uncharacterized protein n=1 Tax=Dictyobacter alpinus TaxID=2014873 RepID=A0A402BJ89_9CHLR|nr:hypothetical protein [Dictyobacter alpinus]GCE31352.1 hypothetical protein KDA_68360 [Dictyobacter alpinus]
MELTYKQLTLLLMFLGADLLVIGVFDKYVIDIWGCTLCYVLVMIVWLHHTIITRKREQTHRG